MIKSLFLCLMLISCSAINPPKDFEYKLIKTDYFELASWQKITNHSQPIKIYIEGDGYAFDKRGKATSNPTPKGNVVRKMAFNDAYSNVVYLARPCQFIKNDKCLQKYWTTARFSKEVIDSTSQAIKNIAGSQEVILIGYSGGGNVACLLAVLHQEIKVSEIITYGANLDHNAWAKHHKLPLLSDSLDLVDYKQELSSFRQLHYLGEDDKIVPPFLNVNFLNDGTKYQIIKGVTHTSF